MTKRYSRMLMTVLALVYGSGTWSNAQQAQFQVSVDLVQLNVAVTDGKGNYVTGLTPSDFQVTEDTIAEKIAFFGEGNGPARSVGDATADEGKPLNASYPNASYTTREVTSAPEQTDSL